MALGSPTIDFLGSPRHFLSPKFWLIGTKREFFNSHGMLQQLTRRKLKTTVVLENECIRIYRSGGGADDGGGGNTLPLALICAFATPQRKSKRSFALGMLDPWITTRHTLPA